METIAMIFPNSSDIQAVDTTCSGCAWIREEIERYRVLADEFRALGFTGFADLAEDGIASLEEDRRRHFRRDH
jgi:hypothetical protein